jgi:hypothetical protein
LSSLKQQIKYPANQEAKPASPPVSTGPGDVEQDRSKYSSKTTRWTYTTPRTWPQPQTAAEPPPTAAAVLVSTTENWWATAVTMQNWNGTIPLGTIKADTDKRVTAATGRTVVGEGGTTKTTGRKVATKGKIKPAAGSTTPSPGSMLNSRSTSAADVRLPATTRKPTRTKVASTAQPTLEQPNLAQPVLALPTTSPNSVLTTQPTRPSPTTTPPTASPTTSTTTTPEITTTTTTLGLGESSGNQQQPQQSVGGILNSINQMVSSFIQRFSFG